MKSIEDFVFFLLLINLICPVSGKTFRVFESNTLILRCNIKQ